MNFSDGNLKKHDKSQDHKNCFVMWVSYKNMKIRDKDKNFFIMNKHQFFMKYLNI